MRGICLSVVFLLLVLGEGISTAQQYASSSNYGPSRGIMPKTYANLISGALNNKDLAKNIANEAISLYLDDDCPLPKNFYGELKDEKGNDAVPIYHSNTGSDDLMRALFDLYLKYPDDPLSVTCKEKVIAFADLMINRGTDRFGSVHSPLLASILTREEYPRIPEDPDNMGHSVKIAQANVYSYDEGGMRTNYVAYSLGNYWYGSDESHKISWHGADLADDEDLYELLYKMSDELGDPKYREAAESSLMFFITNCPSETYLLPWGEHAGWDFYADHYDTGYYHAPLHEYRGGSSLYDRFVSLQPRVTRWEFTAMEKYTLGFFNTHYRFVDAGTNIGRLTYCRHGTLWTDRKTAVDAGQMEQDFGMFPKHAGAWLRLWSQIYDRSANGIYRDSIVAQTIAFADGVEGIREAAGTDYYPYGGLNWDGSFRSISNAQNGNLATGAAEAAWFFSKEEALAEKLRYMANVAGSRSVLPVYHYPGPDPVTINYPPDMAHIGTDTVNLYWNLSGGALSYDLYFSDNISDIQLATKDSSAFKGNQAEPFFKLASLEKNKTYYWAVDAVGSSISRRGEIMRFNTDENIVPPESVSIIQGDRELVTGNAFYLLADVYPGNATDRSVRWSSSDGSVVSVTLDGYLTALAPGSAEITATTSDSSSSDGILVTVHEAVIPLNFVDIIELFIEGTVGDTFQLHYRIDPPNATYSGVTWSSTNPEVATVSRDGLVKILSAGFAEIILRSADEMKSDKIFVSGSWPVSAAAGPGNQVRIYPNPVHDILYLDGIQPQDTFSIMDFLGKTLLEGEASITNVDMTAFSNGNYIVKIMGLSGVQIFRLMKL